MKGKFTVFKCDVAILKTQMERAACLLGSALRVKTSVQWSGGESGREKHDWAGEVVKLQCILNKSTPQGAWGLGCSSELSQDGLKGVRFLFLFVDQYLDAAAGRH